jgi:hypothetical protein
VKRIRWYISPTVSSLLVGVAWLTLPVCGLAAGDRPGQSSVLFTASDFDRLAQGVDAGIGGEATVSVWAPSEEEWRLESDGPVLTLLYQRKPGDRQPSWRVLGKVTLDGEKALKVRAADGAEKAAAGRSKTAGSEPAKSKQARSDHAPSQAASGSTERIPVPACLWISAGASTSEEPVMDLVRGRLDSLEPPPDLRRTHVRSNQQGAEFQAPSSAAAWQDRARHLREQMLVTLGLWPMFSRTPLNPKVYGKLDRGDYTIEKVVLETFPGFTLSGNLYRPAAGRGRIPGLLCPHGHWADGRMNPEVQERCIRWAKLGCVVFMYDMVGYNDSKPFTHKFKSDWLRRWGLSLATLQTWNSIRALDWLNALPDVDPVRIGCTGESGGGTQTFLLTALDPRIAVSAPVVMVSDSFQGGCECENSPGLRHGTDNVEFAALCAPRPLFLVGASGDWTARTMERAYPAIRGVYSLCGVRERVGAQVFDFPHNYNQTSRNAVYAFMAHWLLGIDDAKRTREGAQQPEKAEDLATFNAKTPAPQDRKTPEQLESFLIGALDRALEELAPSASSVDWEASRRLLATSLSIRVGLVNPAPEEIVDQEVRRVVRQGLTIVHSVIGRKAVGDAIPVVRCSPSRPAGRLTIVVHPAGKAALADGSGNPGALARALLARGQDVVGFDPLFVGESLDSRRPSIRRPDTDHFETYNPGLAADQIQDLATVCAWARARPEARQVNLVAVDRSGLQALLARPLLEGLARTVCEVSSLPHPGDTRAFPPSLDLSGMYQFGGFEAAAALAAPAPLWLHGAPAFESSWPRSAYALAGAENSLRIDLGNPSADRIAEWIDRGE